MPDKLVYLGPEGTYSHQAAEKYKTPDLELVPLSTITKVIDSVNAGDYKYGIVPIENMIEGSVNTTLDKLARKNNRLYIVEEIDIPIKHQLLALRGVKKSDIRIIFSHQQALEQCRGFLEKEFPRVKIITVKSTAEAAKKIKEKRLFDRAAIGSRAAQKKYNLEFLCEHIADYKNNFTRFVVLTKELRYPIDKSVTSFVFSCRKDKPGSLFNILRFLAEAKINMTKIESRPSKAVLGDYIFFVDIDGSPKQTKVQKALEDIQKQSDYFKLLGVYQRRK
ncbi:prephenate dehydratase [Candidatus Termititenax spirochaetophilus]|uniref:Prephenate dehydratase n=1 Tax=Candidatus Termititenax spirochaetophilus TaxID=2218522 RepID=A0A388T847_9BACT|nr:prephenate dehydratase [Candidatus Termititenax spirochaetophilus]